MTAAAQPRAMLGPSAAYYAAKFGWAVFPLHWIASGRCSCKRPDCGNWGKHPLVGHGFLDATRDPQQIQAWWDKWPLANIGIATGRASGLVVLDVDPRNGGEDSLEGLRIQHGPLPPTVQSRTGGGGDHYLFAYPALPVGDRIQSGKFAPGLDLKADGGYIVAPPSIHASGRAYAWEASSVPGETPFAPPPAWLLEGRAARPAVQQGGPSGVLEESFLYRVFGAAGWLGARIDSARVSVRCPWSSDHTSEAGARDTSSVLFAPSGDRTLGWFHCSHSHCAGRSIEDVLAAAPAEAVTRAKREEAAARAAMGGPASGPVSAPAAVAEDAEEQGPEAEDPQAAMLRAIKEGRAFEPQVLAYAAAFTQGSEDFQALLAAVKEAGKNSIDWRAGVRDARKLRVVKPVNVPAVRRFERGDHLELAEALLLDVEPTAERRANDEGAIHRYDPSTGLWSKLDRSVLAVAVHGFAGSVVPSKDGERPLLINSPTVDGAIEQAGHITRRPDFFAEAVHGLAFADGFVHAKPGGLEWSGHSPEHRARVGYPFAYPAEGSRDCPRFLAFLRSVWPVKIENEAGEPRTAEEIEALGADQEAKILLCQQFLGASLVGIATRFQTALVLFGAGSNGKSTLIKTAEHLFPKGSLSHVAPQDLGDEYRLALLAGKLLNTVGELPTAAILDSARLKSVIDGTEITGRQIRQEPITFTPRAGMVYSANLWPPVADMSHGFWSRFAVLTFCEQFPRGTAGEDLDVIMAREEGPGIIAWMLGGAASVLKSRGYTVPASSGAALEEWRNQACTVAAFLRECCDVPAPTANKAQRASYEESAYKLFETYVRHTREGQRPPVSRQSFKNRMSGLGHPVKERAAGNFYPVRLKLP